MGLTVPTGAGPVTLQTHVATSDADAQAGRGVSIRFGEPGPIKFDESEDLLDVEAVDDEMRRRRGIVRLPARYNSPIIVDRGVRSESANEAGRGHVVPDERVIESVRTSPWTDAPRD